MKKLAITALITAFLAPAAAFAITKHKVTHPRPVHQENPYLKHPNFKAQRHRHKKI